MSETWLWCGMAEDEEDLGPREPSPRGRFPRWPRPDMATEKEKAAVGERGARSLHAERRSRCASDIARYHRSKFFYLCPSRDFLCPGTGSPRAF